MGKGADVHIDRIVLRGFDLTQERAEKIRSRVLEELEGIIARNGLPEGGTRISRSHLAAEAIRPGDLQSDSGLARSIAHRAYQAIRSAR